VELRYDFSDPDHLRDWKKEYGTAPTIEKGEMVLVQRSGIQHVAKFAGTVDVTAVWMVRLYGTKGRCHGIHMNNSIQFWPRAILIQWEGNRLVDKPITFPARVTVTSRIEQSSEAVKVWINGKPFAVARNPVAKPVPVRIGASATVVAYDGIRIVGRLDPGWLKSNPRARKQIDAIRAAEKGSTESDPSQDYAKAVALLRLLWRKRAYAEALALAKQSGDPEFVRDAEALVGLWTAAQAGLGKLKPGEPFRVRGMAGTVVDVTGDTIKVKAGAAELLMKLDQVDDAGLAVLAGKARALTSAEDLLALALVEVHSKSPDLAKALKALTLASNSGVNVSRHHAFVQSRYWQTGAPTD
jgi:hypothetical protein